MRIVYRGNFQPDLPPDVVAWSTETHVAGSLELLGHEVVRVQENTARWDETMDACLTADLFMWTSTHGFANLWPRQEAERAVALLSRGMPTVGVHLDLWWGLAREAQIAEEPFFKLGWLFTADGDHDELWEAAGIKHRWMPPGVYGPECVPGTPNPEWASDVAFVGSWDGYGHAEWWPHRKAMLDRARDAFGDRLALWPRPGRGAVRSGHLNDLMASVKVVLGDSCMADRSTRYFSDRVFETVGRGGVLVMPRIPGLERLLPPFHGVLYHDDLDEMVEHVEYLVADDAERERVRKDGQAFVAEHHTYERRLADVLASLTAEGAFG